MFFTIEDVLSGKAWNVNAMWITSLKNGDDEKSAPNFELLIYQADGGRPLIESFSSAAERAARRQAIYDSGYFFNLEDVSYNIGFIQSIAKVEVGEDYGEGNVAKNPICTLTTSNGRMIFGEFDTVAERDAFFDMVYEAQFVTRTEAGPFVKNVEYDPEYCIFTFTMYNGTIKKFDLPLEWVVKDGEYDDKKKELILTLVNGEKIHIPIHDLVDIYDGTENDQIKVTVTDNIIEAILKEASITEDFLSEEVVAKLHEAYTGKENDQIKVEVDGTEIEAILKEGSITEDFLDDDVQDKLNREIIPHVRLTAENAGVHPAGEKVQPKFTYDILDVGTAEILSLVIYENGFEDVEYEYTGAMSYTATYPKTDEDMVYVFRLNFKKSDGTETYIEDKASYIFRDAAVEYTGKENDQIKVDVDNDSNEIEATLKEGSISEDFLDEDVKEKLNKECEVYTGVENDQIKVDINDDNEVEATLKEGSISEDFLDEDLQEKINKEVTGAENDQIKVEVTDGEIEATLKEDSVEESFLSEEVREKLNRAGVKVFLSDKELNTDICGTTELGLADLGLTDYSDLQVDQLVYDADGTVAYIVSIDEDNDTITVETTTIAGLSDIVNKVFEYIEGYKFTIDNPGSGYEVGDVVGTDVYGVNVEVLAVDANGEVTDVKFTRSEISASGTLVSISTSDNADMFIIPDSVWALKGLKFELTNEDGAFVYFYKEGDVTVKYAVGNGKIYRFEFDKVNGVIYQEAIDIEVGSSNIVFDEKNNFPTLGNEETIYIATDEDKIYRYDGIDYVSMTADIPDSRIKEYDEYSTGDEISEGVTITKNKVLYRATSDVTVSDWDTDSSNFEELKTSGAILNNYEQGRYYAENEMIIEGTIIYRRITAGVAQGVTLGEDIANWEPRTALHTSGQRYVRYTANSSSVTNVTNSWYSLKNIIYTDGDQAMIGDNYVKAPVDGLYYIEFNGISSLASAGMSRVVLTINDFFGSATSSNQDNALTAFSLDGTSAFARAVCIIHLKKGDKIYFNISHSTPISEFSNIPSEFGLLAEDQSENVVAEAEVSMPSSIIANTLNTVSYVNSTNPSVIKPNGDIVLPEDGVYILSIDRTVSANGTSGNASTYLNQNGVVLAQNTTQSATNVQYPSITHIVNGSKNDVITFTSIKSTTQSGLTYSSDKPMVRLIKIKSVSARLTSEDLYIDYKNNLPEGVEPMSYEDFVKSLTQRNQLRTVATFNATSTSSGGTIIDSFTKVEGEDTIVDGKKFVAPISGLYHFHIDTRTVEGSFNDWYATTVFKNSDVGDYNNTVARSADYTASGTRFKMGVDTTVWLDKGDYLTVSLQQANGVINDMIPQGNVEFTLIQSGYDMINHPNMWVPDKEYDFGYGLYGKRYVGVNSQLGDVLIDSSFSPNLDTFKVVDQGGTLVYEGQGAKVAIPFNSAWGNQNYFSILWWTTAGFYLNFNVNKKDPTTPVNYDIWVKYTK